jgi:surface protein
MGIIAASRLREAPINTDAFIIEVNTTLTSFSNSNQFQFTGAVGDYNVVAKQGGSVVQTFINLSGQQTITLPSNGVFVLEVTPKETNPFNQIKFQGSGDRSKILDIKQWGTTVWSSFEKAFFKCQFLSITATDVPNLTNVSNMRQMLSGIELINSPLNSWDVSNVTNMLGMFRSVDSFNQPLNSWNVSNVTEMSEMFENCLNFNQPLNSWNVSSVTNMTDMFRSADSFNQPLNSWNVSNVTSMRLMFYRSGSFNQDLSGWCVEQISSRPTLFDDGANDWVLPNSRPIWGTCP